MIPEHLPTLDLEEAWESAERESWQPPWVYVLACVALLGYAFASEMDYREAVQTEALAIPPCESCLVAEPVRYGEGAEFVFVDWHNEGETW